MPAIDRYLTEVYERKGSDLHFLAGDPARIRLYGEIKPLFPEPLDPAMVKAALYEIMPKLAVERFEAKDGTDFAYSLPGVARFRVNVMRHLGGMGGIFRAIPSKARSMDELDLPAAVRNLTQVNSGLILVTQDALLHYLFRLLHIHNRSMKWMFKTLRWVVIIPLFYFAIAYIYKHAPSIREKWRLFSPGTLLATVLMILLTFVFSFWVNKFGTYNKVYGSIGTILILMVVVFFNALILLIGFELNVSIHSLKEKALRRESLEK